MFNLSSIDVPDLTGKTVLVSGAKRGIGAVLAGLLTARGAEVYAGVQGDPESEWAQHLAHSQVVQMDVTDPAAVKGVMERIEQKSGKLDALVNNAGVISPIGHIDTLDTEAFRSAFDVNALALHRVTCAALPLLRKSRGVVVNAGTGAATTPMEGWTAYCSSKAAARMLTLMFAKDLSESGVQFFFLGIPPTDTNMQCEIRVAGLNPISKIAKSDLVDPKVPASVMAWLCGPEARNLTDVTIDVRDDFFKAMMTL